LPGRYWESSYKTDVKSRAKDSVNEKVDSVKSEVTGAKDNLLGTVSDEAGSVGDSVSAAAGTVSDRASGAAGTISNAEPSGQDVKQASRVEAIARARLQAKGAAADPYS
jgi:hypothetical protein